MAGRACVPQAFARPSGTTFLLQESIPWVSTLDHNVCLQILPDFFTQYLKLRRITSRELSLVVHADRRGGELRRYQCTRSWLTGTSLYDNEATATLTDDSDSGSLTLARSCLSLEQRGSGGCFLSRRLESNWCAF